MEVTLVLYGKPNTKLLKLKGFMKENNKGVPKQLWEHTSLLFCQTCARLTFTDTSFYNKHRVNLLLSHMIEIGRMTQLEEVTVLAKGRPIRYPTAQEFCDSSCVYFSENT